MKFNKLEIHNIASIENAIIDFEAEPLLSSEVFLITGKTGSGKSTILDAICLALYNKTPRLANTNMEGYMSDSGNTDKEVSVSDCRQFMRKNTGYAYASLSFTDNENNKYIATWSVQRAHKKPGRTLQDVNWTLEDQSKATTLTKKREIENRIAEIIGLDFQQFCRTTMLAQGEFTRFLNSKDDEKAQIIEKLTGANIYSKIGKKIFETTRKKETLYKEAQNQVSSMKILDSEEVEKLNTELKNIDKIWNERHLEKKSLNEKIDWISQKAKLDSELQKATQEKEEANQKQDNQTYKDKVSLTQNWNKTIEPRARLNEISNTKIEQNEIKKTLDLACSEYILGLNTKEFQKKEIQNITNNLSYIETYLKSEEENVSTYNNVQKIDTNIGTILLRRENISKTQKDIKTYQKNITTKKAKIQSAISNATLKKSDVEKKDKDIKNLSKEIEEIKHNLTKSNISSLTTSEKLLNTYIHNLEIAQTMVSNYEEKIGENKNKHKEIEGVKRKIDELKSEFKAAQENVSKAEQEKNLAEKQYEWQKTFIDKWAKSLRSKLTLGCTCPVCQQKVQSLNVNEEILDNEYNKAEKSFNTAKENYENHVANKNKIQIDIDTQTQLCEKYIKEYDNNSNIINSHYNKTIAHCQSYNILPTNNNSLEGISEKIKESIAETQKKIEDISKKITAATKIQEKLNQCQSDLTSAQEKRNNLAQLYNSAKEDVTTQQNELSRIYQSIDACKQNIKDYTNEIILLSQDVNEHIPSLSFINYLKQTNQQEQSANNCKGWENDWFVNTELFRLELKARAERFQEQKERVRNYQEIIDQSSKDFNRIESIVQDIIAIMPSWNSVNKTAEKDVLTENKRVISLDKLVTYFNKLYSKIKSENDRLQTELKRQEKAENKLNNYLKSLVDNLFATKIDIPYLEKLNTYNQEQISELTKEINNINTEVTSKKSAFLQARKNFNTHIETKPLLLKNEEESVEGMLLLKNNLRALEEEMRRLDQQKGGIENELKQDVKNKESQKKLVEEAEEKKKEFHKWARLNQLIGDSTGKTFQKIAQSYVLSSLIHSANSYMKSLTNRYRLVVDPGTFIIYIEDAYQGYVRRAASTISGGESFLVSLSLALALSDIGHEFAVDTLFIDEGFGTLSGEPLQNAINTLRTLHSKAGRKVGIISHVEELQEKIPVQIKVKQDGNNSSSKVEIVTI